MALLANNEFIAESDKEELLLLQSGFGRKTGGKLILHQLEAAYASECKLIKVLDRKKELTTSQILSKPKKSKNSLCPLSLAEQYSIYKRIRLGGRIVRFSPSSPQYWRVYSRGVGREQERPQMLVRLIDSKWNSSLSNLEKELSVARLLRLELALAYLEGKEPKFIKLAKQTFD